MAWLTYTDVEGRMWIRLDESTIWNSEAGYGGWFDGKGLTPVLGEQSI